MECGTLLEVWGRYLKCWDVTFSLRTLLNEWGRYFQSEIVTFSVRTLSMRLGSYMKCGDAKFGDVT